MEHERGTFNVTIALRQSSQGGKQPGGGPACPTSVRRCTSSKSVERALDTPHVIAPMYMASWGDRERGVINKKKAALAAKMVGNSYSCDQGAFFPLHSTHRRSR
mmetsp:Transcript_18157/g.50129  ORF Transcript_18157/g.50129 Transcript_18157/m.50129 type:complete len:104 (+) Transcript_18157:199-510(+)